MSGARPLFMLAHPAAAPNGHDRMSETDLTGKVAIVTGGGGGMGRVIALALAERGACVAALDIRRAEAEAVAEAGACVADSEAVLPLAEKLLGALAEALAAWMPGAALSIDDCKLVMCA